MNTTVNHKKSLTALLSSLVCTDWEAAIFVTAAKNAQ
jgi:hypothetical protein